MTRPAIPLSLYIHFPWCVRKCPYCDFNSHALSGGVDQAAYVDALLRDLDRELARLRSPAPRSVFIGGGTPSLIEAAQLERLLSSVGRRMTLAGDIEITLEANPGASEAERFAAYRRAGVNRLSIGVQSFDDGQLGALGRVHTAAEARAAYRAARDAGFDNINIDLMYGLPGQTPAAALDDLGEAIALGPEHLSWYQLTLEPNTPFHREPPSLPDDDVIAGITDEGLQKIAAAGFRRYEVSAFAREGRRCRHNLNYWQFGDYLGIGAGAHGKLSVGDGRVERCSKARGPAAYLAAEGAAPARRTLDRRDLKIEFFLNALRLVDGVEAGLFSERTGLDLAEVAAPLALARSRGLMACADTRLQPTAQGLCFLNELLVLFDGG